VPAAWTSVVVGPAFVRGDPLTDPTRLVLRTYRNTSPAAALRDLSSSEGISVRASRGARAEALRWRRFRGREAGAPQLAVDVAVASDGADTHLAALVARRSELALVVVITAHLAATADATAVTRWLLEGYILRATR
jgi:hypothetical protein